MTVDTDTHGCHPDSRTPPIQISRVLSCDASLHTKLVGHPTWKTRQTPDPILQAGYRMCNDLKRLLRLSSPTCGVALYRETFLDSSTWRKPERAHILVHGERHRTKQLLMARRETITTPLVLEIQLRHVLLLCFDVSCQQLPAHCTPFIGCHPCTRAMLSLTATPKVHRLLCVVSNLTPSNTLDGQGCSAADKC